MVPKMIKAFKCRETRKIFHRKMSRKFPQDIQQRAYQRLNQLNAAVSLNDLRVPSSNRLEALVGNRSGQHSLRINQQWRLCFVWLGNDATEVEIVDYH